MQKVVGSKLCRKISSAVFCAAGFWHPLLCVSIPLCPQLPIWVRHSHHLPNRVAFVGLSALPPHYMLDYWSTVLNVARTNTLWNTGLPPVWPYHQPTRSSVDSTYSLYNQPSNNNNNNNNQDDIYSIVHHDRGHCESSFGSSGECRAVPSGRRPSDQATWLGLRVCL